MPYIGKTTDGFGVRNRFVYLATSGATSVSGADANGATLTFTDGAYVDVYLNGVLLKPTTDYNTSTANTIAGLSALNTNDEVTVVVYDVFTVADMVSATSGGTFSGNVTFNGDISVGDDVSLASDSAVLNFGADNDVTLTHVADTGLTLNTKLGISGATAGSQPNEAEDIIIGTTSATDNGMSIVTANNSVGRFYFADATSGSAAYAGYMIYDHSADAMQLGTASSTALKIDGNGHVTMPKQSAFMAYLSSSTFNLANGSAQTLSFQTEQFDLNADFASNTTFTAPVSGKYMLTASVRLDSLQSNTNYAYLGWQTSNRNIVFWLSAPQDWNGGAYYTANGAVLCDMDANDTAYIYFFGQGGTDQADHTDGYFSGYLVA